MSKKMMLWSLKNSLFLRIKKPNFSKKRVSLNSPKTHKLHSLRNPNYWLTSRRIIIASRRTLLWIWRVLRFLLRRIFAFFVEKEENLSEFFLLQWISHASPCSFLIICSFFCLFWKKSVTWQAGAKSLEHNNAYSLDWWLSSSILRVVSINRNNKFSEII